MKPNKRNRQESAIKRVAIMEDKEMSTGATDKVESIRQHKIKSAKTTIENTKSKMR